jgi:uracil-DNA glycosylase family 4
MHHWSYSRCALCPHTHRQVLPNGPLDARIAIVGEGPGWNEAKTGIPFCGKAGQELDETYLRLAGLDRSEVFVTNMVQCRQERNGVDVRPSEALTQCCAENHLREELATVDPKIVVLCGATACSMFPDIDLELEHGFPRLIGSTWVAPMYHPAAGLHETRYMTPMLEDWERLGMWMRGRWHLPDDDSVPWAGPKYELLKHDSDWRAIDIPQWVAVDTETDEGKPYSIQFATGKGRGYMVLAEDRSTVGRLLDRMGGRSAAFHNASFDLDVCDRLGIHFRGFRDTMQELYHLGNLPQGLKAAVYRVFGYKMTSYDEVVTPHSKAQLETWLAEALAHVSMEMCTFQPHPIGKGCPTCGKGHRKDMSVNKPHEAEAVLRRVLEHLPTDYDPWEKSKQDKGTEKPRLIGRPWLDEIERAVGRMPRRSIVHAPLEQQVKYACGDADWTLRLAGWLEGERKRIVREEWCVT